MSALAAATIALVAWWFLPYEYWERQTSLARFEAWEAAMFMGGGMLVLFGFAAFFGSTDLYARPVNPDHVIQRVRAGVRGEHEYLHLPSVPWVITCTGLLLILQAAVMRPLLGF